LAGKGTNVDEEIEPVVNACGSDSRIHDDALPIAGFDAHLFLRNLFGDKGRDVGLESAGSETHNEQSDDEGRKSAVWLIQNIRGRRGHEDNVTNFSNDDGINDGVETSKVGVGNPGGKQLIKKLC
jgi:hypothetical protein